MVKKINIDIDYAADYTILGLVSYDSDYQLVHHINRTLNTHFSKFDDFIFNESNGLKPSYAWYYCYSNELKINAYIIANKHTYINLLPDFSKIDYVIILEKINDTQQLNTIIKNIRKIKSVIGVFNVDVRKIKKIDLLIEKNEIHQLNCVKS